MKQQFYLKNDFFLYKIQEDIISSINILTKDWEFEPIDKWDVAYGGYDIGDEITKDEALKYLKDHNISESIIDKRVEYDDAAVREFQKREEELDKIYGVDSRWD